MQRHRIGIALAVLAIVFPISSIANADLLPCPSAHVATQQEADAASPKGSIIAGYTMVCPGDAVLGISNEAGTAKDYLKTILCKPDGDNYGGVGPDETIRGLDAKFAQCAATFLKQLNSTGVPYCIAEGKRSVAKQQEYASRPIIACGQNGKPADQCEHPRGIAIDIKVPSKPGAPCTDFTRAHQLAPQFGLTFYLGCKDAYHFVPQKMGCSSGGTAPAYGSGASGVSTGGTNANGYIPSSYYDYPQYAPATSPYSTALNALTPLLSNSLLNSNTQQSTVPAYTNPAPYEPVTLPTATSSIFTVPPPYEYPFLGTTTRSTTPSTGPSAYEQIQMLTGATTSSSQSTQSGTSAPTQLNPNLSDIVRGNGTGGSNIIEDIGVQDTLAINSVAVNPIHVTETFTHDEPTLVAPPTATSGTVTTSANQTLIVALLTTVRNLLVSFVNVLKSHSTSGFQGAWQTPASSAVYH